MKKTYATLIFIFLSLCVYANRVDDGVQADTNEVIKLNIAGYKAHLTNHNETILYANRALELAKKIGYANGIAEAYRIRGIGKYYMNKPDSAINDYFEALKNYKDNPSGRAKVFNNIGNLYQEIDNEQALHYFNEAEIIAKATHDDQLLASLNLNIGNVYVHKNSFNTALNYFLQSFKQFTNLTNKTPNTKFLLVQCMQDLGVAYNKLDSVDKAEKTLLKANAAAKELDMNSTIASIDLTLTEIYLKQNKFEEDERYLKEGLNYSNLINNDKDIYDYNKSYYELESKRKNYQKALIYLTEIFKKDNVTYNNSLSTNINLALKEKDHKAEIDKDANDKKNANQRFWLLAVAAGLLLVVIALLMSNVKRKARTNEQLKELNNEVSRQKDNLDRINHHLEEIIDERTQDLQAKNRKLSEYSSYLSHQIRGPIATLKGLMNLEKEGLVDQAECIKMMDKCVSEIDEKIIEMSDMLHDTGKTEI